MNLAKVKDKFDVLMDMYKSIDEYDSHANVVMQWIIDSASKCLGTKPDERFKDLGFEQKFNQDAYEYCANVLCSMDKYVKFCAVYIAMESLEDMELESLDESQEIDALLKAIDIDIKCLKDLNKESVQQLKCAFIATMISNYSYHFIKPIK